MIVYGERLLAGPGGAQAARALLNVASRLGLAGRDGAGLLEAPAAANARGLREAGFAPGHGPGYATRRRARHGHAPASPRRSPTASSRRSGCTTPTRCARSPTAPPGRPRSAPPRP